MAISSLLLRHSSPLLSTKPTTENSHSNYKINRLALRSVTCKNSLRTDTATPTGATLSTDSKYKHLWQEELKRAYPSEIASQQWENDAEKYQALVDIRCVDNVRMLIVDSVNHVKAGHPGMALGMAEVGYFLYRHVMRYNPRNPKWFNRDRFVLSAGHGCLLQYVCLHLAGFQSVQVHIYA